ncbi:hypothetical protein PV458_06095 [Streptomyces sp. MN03-5084-2B]|nr:hypothetical protein [Streptomyces sp. MN03-5084-2B]
MSTFPLAGLARRQPGQAWVLAPVGTGPVGGVAWARAGSFGYGSW